MFNGSFLSVCRILRFLKKIRFCLLESGRTKPWCPGLVSRPSAKAQEPVARSRGLVIYPPKLSVGAYFELLFLGCIFSPQNCNILHTLKKEPLNIMLLHTSRRMDGSRGLVIQPPKLSVGAHFELSILGCGFLIHLSNRSDSPRFRAPWKKIRQKYGTQP